ncbi:hypothetical protein ACHAWU_002253 [Discostella pseudostelligera]|uniref:Uncharacterized protein n=1 Tax=Discostella pseudostelligera TaxID=259834 RepID=A0ABD3MMS8_9STRA
MFQSNDNDDMFSLTQHVTLPKIIPCAVIQGEVGDIRTKWMDERRKHWIRPRHYVHQALQRNDHS